MWDDVHLGTASPRAPASSLRPQEWTRVSKIHAREDDSASAACPSSSALVSDNLRLFYQRQTASDGLASIRAQCYGPRVAYSSYCLRREKQSGVQRTLLVYLVSRRGVRVAGAAYHDSRTFGRHDTRAVIERRTPPTRSAVLDRPGYAARAEDDGMIRRDPIDTCTEAKANHLMATTRTPRITHAGPPTPSTDLPSPPAPTFRTRHQAPRAGRARKGGAKRRRCARGSKVARAPGAPPPSGRKRPEAGRTGRRFSGRDSGHDVGQQQQPMSP